MNEIVIVSFKYPPVYSGYGKQLKSIIDSMEKNNLNEFNITILTAYKESAFKSEKIEVIPLLGKYDHKNTSVHKFSLKVLFWLYRERKKYSFIHCIKAGPEAVMCNIISKIFNKKLLVKVTQEEFSDREIEDSKGISLINKIIRHKLLANVDMFIAISDEIEENLRKKINSDSKIIRIPNGVEVENEFYPVDYATKRQIRNNLKIDNEEIVVLYAGAINKRKGTHDLLAALEKVQSSQPVRCIICGPILEDIGFDKKVKQINKHNNLYVDYRGTTDETYLFMQASDIFVLPSYSEGLPNVLLEAAASGLALVSTDIGGSRDIVEENTNGLLFSPGAQDQLADKLELLIRNKSKRMAFGKAARKTVVGRYSLAHVTQEYVDLYRKILG